MQLVNGTVIASRYRVGRLLGRGGMGAVYLAKHIHTGERVALKVLLLQGEDMAQTIERFRREMRTPARIRSEHVTRVTDADVAPELGGAPFLVMELLDGCDLARLLKSRGTLRAAEVAWIFGQIAQALDKAHSLGVVHRDLKPENLFLHSPETGGLIVKLLDFGIARMIRPDRFSIAEAKLTSTGSLLGTPTYMSPEQVRAQSAQIGAMSDIWSLGLIAFQLLAGYSYWQASSFGELIAQILFEPMQTPSMRAPHLPPGFDAWFARSCARESAQRWPSASAQAAALAEALGLDALPEERSAPPAALSATVEDVLCRDRAAREDADEEESGAVVPEAGRRTPGTLFVPPADTIRAQQRPPTSRRRMLMIMAGSVIAALAGTLQATRLHESTQLPPQQRREPSAVYESVQPEPMVPVTSNQDRQATPAAHRRRAVPALAVPPAKMRRRAVADKMHDAVPPAPSVTSAATASGYDPDGR